MKKVLLLSGVNNEGYGNIETIDGDDVAGLLKNIFYTDESTVIALVIENGYVNMYNVSVTKTSLPFRSV